MAAPSPARKHRPGLHTPLSAEQAKLVTAHIGLAKYWANKKARCSSDKSYDEFLSEAYLGLVKAAAVFNPELGKFPSLATCCIKNEFRNAFKKDLVGYYPGQSRGDRPVFVEIDEDGASWLKDPAKPIEARLVHDVERAACCRLLLALMRRLNVFERRAIKSYWLDGQATVQIARSMRCRVEGVSRLIQAGMAKMAIWAKEVQ